MSKTMTEVERRIRRIERKLSRIVAEMPERVFSVYCAGLDDGRIVGRRGLSVQEMKDLYAKALERIEMVRSK